MREDSQRGAPRSGRAPGRPGAGRDTRTPRSDGQNPAQGYKTGSVPNRGAPDRGAPDRGAPDRGAPRGSADTARLTSVIEPVLNAMEIDLEAVKLSAAGRRVVLRIVVDADGGISLDDIAEVSRELSARLDAKNVMGDAPYTLEVTSPGVDRPLIQPRHWRRAAGRLVVFESGNAEHKGRVVIADQDGVTFDIDGDQRTFRFADLGPGRVQVEFGRLNEIDDDLEPFHDAEDSAVSSGGSSSRASKEDPDGH